MKASLLTIVCLVFGVLLISTAPSASSQNANSSTRQQDKSQKVIELKATKAPATRGCRLF